MVWKSARVTFPVTCIYLFGGYFWCTYHPNKGSYIIYVQVKWYEMGEDMTFGQFVAASPTSHMCFHHMVILSCDWYDCLISCSIWPLIHLGHGAVVVWMALISTWNDPRLLRLRGGPVAGHGRTSKQWVMRCSVWQWGMVAEELCSPYLKIGGGSNMCFTPAWRRNFDFIYGWLNKTISTVYNFHQFSHIHKQNWSTEFIPDVTQDMPFVQIGLENYRKIGIIRTLLFNGFTQRNSNHQFLGKIAEGGPLYALLMLFQMG